MTKTRTAVTGVAIAGAGLIATALVTPALSAGAEGGDGAAPQAPSATESAAAQRALTGFSCNGGATKAVRNAGIYDGAFEIPTTGTKRLPGKITLKGPKKGKDTVSVAVTGYGVLYSAYQHGYVDVLVDGKPLRPSTLSSSTPFMVAGNTSDYEVGAAQFCGRIGKGKHNVKVRFKNTSGSQWYLYSATAHVEQNN